MSQERPEAAPLATLGQVWLVGCGNLGRALAAGWLDAGLPAAGLTIIEPAPSNLPAGVRAAVAPAHDLARPHAIVLAVKPQQFGAIAPELAPHSAGTLVLSVLAGAATATLEAGLPGARIVRALPSTPARIRRAVTLLVAGASATAADRGTADALMRAIGTTHWIDEAAMDAASAVTASGPAFLFRYLEAMAAAGAAAGLDSALSLRLAIEAVNGSAALAAADARGPAALRAEVTSPGGMTKAGLDVLDGDGALTALLTATVAAAARRSAELGREAA